MPADLLPPDRWRAARIVQEQSGAIGPYLRREVFAHSAFYRSKFEPARTALDALSTTAGLAGLPFTTREEVAAANPGALVLRPDRDSISRGGDPALALKLMRSRTMRREWVIAREVIDPSYKPIQWTDDGGILVGASAADLDRLADLGRRVFESAGVRPEDVVLGLLPPGPSLAFWQLQSGARKGGLSALWLDPRPVGVDIDRIVSLGASCLVAPSDTAERVLIAARRRGVPLASVRTILVAGDTDPPDPGHLTQLQLLAGGGVDVVACWAPPGVRSLWAQCAGGSGLHVWPEAEVVEIVEPHGGLSVTGMGHGEVVWTALGWRGTALVRLRTGVTGHLQDGACPSCGRETPRLILDARVDPTHRSLAAILDEHPQVADWQVELREFGGDNELIVFLAPAEGHALDQLLMELEVALSATQYVVLDPTSLVRRREAAGGAAVVDLRPRVEDQSG